MHLQRDGTHTCRKAIENKGLVFVLNNMFDKCLQTQQPFWRKSIFPCLAAGTVLLGQLRLFVLGRSPTFSCCQTSYTNKLSFSMKHFISLLQLIHISVSERLCGPVCSPFFQMLALLPPGQGCTGSPVAVAHGFAPSCYSGCVRSGFTVHAAFTEGGVYQHRSP